MRSAKVLIATAVLLPLLASCAGNGNVRFPPAGANPVFQSAYTDGCYSGLADASPGGELPVYWRQETRFREDAQYRTGWEEGYRKCYESRVTTAVASPL